MNQIGLRSTKGKPRPGLLRHRPRRAGREHRRTRRAPRRRGSREPGANEDLGLGVRHRGDSLDDPRGVQWGDRQPEPGLPIPRPATMQRPSPKAAAGALRMQATRLKLTAVLGMSLVTAACSGSPLYTRSGQLMEVLRPRTRQRKAHPLPGGGKFPCPRPPADPKLGTQIADQLSPALAQPSVSSAVPTWTAMATSSRSRRAPPTRGSTGGRTPAFHRH